MKIGLFFGSFNPIHTGHLLIANQFVEFTDIEQVWLVVSPHNPLKSEKELMDGKLRLEMAKIATEDNPNINVSDVEFYLSKPSYTINTLIKLKDQHENHQFFIIMGSDSYKDLPKWKDHNEIRSRFTIYIYKRKGFEIDKHSLEQHHIFDFPYLDISATYIRKCLQQKKSVRYLVPDQILPFLT